MKILYVSSEVAPFAKTGGLADVAGSLPGALSRMGHEIKVVMPGYSSIDRQKYPVEVVLPQMLVHFPEGTQRGRITGCTFPGSDFPIYFVEHAGYFNRDGLYQGEGADYEDNAERFAFFCQSTLWMLQGLNWRPDVIVCNDWQTAMIPIYLRTAPQFMQSHFFNQIKLLFTIHNLAFQGLAQAACILRLGLPLEIFNMNGIEFYGQINLLKGGIIYSDKINTVSPSYAREIQTEEFGCGLEGVLQSRAADVSGILNGIDTNDWNPATDPLIPANYSAADLSGKAICKEHLQKKSRLRRLRRTPLIGVISRMTDQKGFDLIAEIFPKMMKLEAQFVLLGTGEKFYHDMMEEFAKTYRGQAAAHLTFNNTLAHEIEAGADMFLMPSRFEPCGLNQMYSLSYGTIPIVRKTGGLADSIVHYNARTASRGTGTGFVFEEYDSKDLLKVVKKAISLYNDKPKEWRQLVLTAMKQDFSWEASARKYEELFVQMTS